MGKPCQHNNKTLSLIAAEGINLCNFGRGFYEEQFCEIILNLDQWFRIPEEMSFKDISYLELWQPFCSAEQNHLAILVEGINRGYQEEHFYEIILNLNLKWFRRICLFNIFYLELCWPYCSAKGNHLCNFGRGHYEEQFCEFISNLGQWFRRRCCFKYFLSGALEALVFS